MTKDSPKQSFLNPVSIMHELMIVMYTSCCMKYVVQTDVFTSFGMIYLIYMYSTNVIIIIDCFKFWVYGLTSFKIDEHTNGMIHMTNDGVCWSAGLE